MKLELLQEDLNKGLSVVSRFVAPRPQLPVLTNILFSSEKNNQLRLAATNLEVGIQYWIGAKVEKTGQVAIPSKELTEFVSYLSPGKISIEAKKKTQIELTSSSGQSSFTGMDSSEFPKMPEVDPTKAMSLPVKSLTEAVKQVGFAAAADDTRPILGAINWQLTDSGYQMVATDGYRLSLKTISGVKVKVGSKEEENFFLIPSRSLIEIIRLSEGQTEVKVGLTSDGNQVIFLLPGVQLTSRLIEGQFPDYKKIIPTTVKTKALIEKEELLQAIKIASVFARESANIVKFTIGKGKISISANAPSVGENMTDVSAKIEGPEIQIAFNFKFLLDFLNAIPAGEKEVLMELTEPLAPGVFKIPSDKSWLHLIMPVRVDL